MKVLIAEDDAVSRTILKKSVEKFGHQISRLIMDAKKSGAQDER